jgi:hypothetical protein
MPYHEEAMPRHYYYHRGSGKIPHHPISNNLIFLLLQVYTTSSPQAIKIPRPSVSSNGAFS